MESTPTENAEILRQILRHFSNKELLKLSLVNQKWNYEARSVLRDRATLIAIIRSNQSCQTITDFAAVLEQMRVVPFSGIKLVLCLEPTPSLQAESLPNESYKTILHRLPCRRFSLKFDGPWEKYRNTPALELVIKILQDFSGLLEKLSFSFHWKQIQLPATFFQDYSFPRLKTLEVAYGPIVDESSAQFIKALVSRAPNLEEFNITGPMNFNENVLDGTSAVLVPSLGLNPLYARVCDGLIGALRTVFIQMTVRPGGFDLELLDRKIPMLLQASSPTLSKLHMDLLFLVPLMCYGICLDNLATLLIHVGDLALPEILPPRISQLLKRFDFTRIFPSLSQVDFKSGCKSPLMPEHISGFVEEANEMLEDALPDRIVNIEKVTLYNPFLDSTVAFLAQMFPDVEISR